MSNTTSTLNTLNFAAPGLWFALCPPLCKENSVLWSVVVSLFRSLQTVYYTIEGLSSCPYHIKIHNCIVWEAGPGVPAQSGLVIGNEDLQTNCGSQTPVAGAQLRLIWLQNYDLERRLTNKFPKFKHICFLSIVGSKKRIKSTLEMHNYGLTEWDHWGSATLFIDSSHLCLQTL